MSKKNPVSSSSRPPQGRGAFAPQAPKRATEASRSQRDRPVLPGNATLPYVDNAKRFTIFLNSEDKTIIERYQKLGIEPMFSKSIGRNPSDHPIAANVRNIMTARALGKLYHRKNFSVVSWYGNDRDLDINQRLNYQVPPGQQMQVRLIRPVLVPGDILRVSFATQADVDFVTQAASLLVDIYELPTGPLNPNSMAALAKKGCYWIGRKFVDCAGVSFLEASWIRLADNTIVFKPGDRALCYAPHDPCDWIWRESSFRLADGKFLVWAVDYSIGDFHAVYFQVVDAIIPQQVYHEQSDFLALEVPVIRIPNWLKVGLRYLPSILRSLIYEQYDQIVRLLALFDSSLVYESVLVYRPLYDHLISFNSQRALNTLSLKQLQVAAVDFVHRDGKLDVLMRHFPEYFNFSNIEKLVLGVFVHRLKDRVEMLENVRSDHSRNIVAYNDLLANVDKAVINAWAVPWKQILVGLPLLYLGLMFMRRFKPPLMSYVIGQVEKLTYADGVVMPVYSYMPLGWIKSVCEPLTQVTIIGHQAIPGFHLAIEAPIFEELIKHIGYYWYSGDKDKKQLKWYKWPGYMIALFIIYWESQGHPWPWWILKLSFHLLTSWLSLGNAICLHAFWNWNVIVQSDVFKFEDYQAPLSMASMASWVHWAKALLFGSATYAAFRARYYIDDWNLRGLYDWWGSWIFSADLALTPTANYSVSELKPFDLALEVVSRLDADVKEPSTSYFWFLPTNVPGYVPARTDCNLQAVIDNRILVEAPLHFLEQTPQWSKLFFVKTHSAPIIWAEWEMEWLNHFKESRKKERYRRARQIYYDHGSNCALLKTSKVEIMVKTDEMLTKFEGRYQLKPRAIANVDPLIQVHVGPYIYGATQRLKNLWAVDSTPIRIGIYTFRFSYAASCRDVDLDEWWRHCSLDCCYSIIVAGDDSLVHYRFRGKNFFYEGDASMFDQSQGAGPLAFEYRVLEDLGVPPAIVKVLGRLSAAKYVAMSKDRLSKCVVKRNLRQMRDTGGADTSIGNSINMLYAWVHAISSTGGDERKFDNYFLKVLGFKMKIKYYQELAQCSFLKGMWYPFMDGEYRWGPLPSRFLKVGKSLKDPRVLYKNPDLYDAAVLFLNDIACSYAPFLRIPLIRVFVANYRVHTARLIFQEEWKIQGSYERAMNLDQCGLMAVCLRYQISQEELIEAESLISTTPFQFISHPIFEKMNLRDYN